MCDYFFKDRLIGIEFISQSVDQLYVSNIASCGPKKEVQFMFTRRELESDCHSRHSPTLNIINIIKNSVYLMDKLTVLICISFVTEQVEHFLYASYVIL